MTLNPVSQSVMTPPLLERRAGPPQGGNPSALSPVRISAASLAGRALQTGSRPLGAWVGAHAGRHGWTAYRQASARQAATDPPGARSDRFDRVA
jgi:hypothetical protein